MKDELRIAAARALSGVSPEGPIEEVLNQVSQAFDAAGLNHIRQGSMFSFDGGETWLDIIVSKPGKEHRFSLFWP